MMDWFKKRLKYIALGAGCGVIAYFAYIKVAKHWHPKCDEHTSFNILDKTLDLESSLSDSLFRDLSSNGDTTISDTLVTNATDDDTTLCDSTAMIDVDFDEASDDGDDEEKKAKKVLFLGLQGSGKSFLLSKLSRNVVKDDEYKPTKGYNVVCITNLNFNISMWEIGGSPLYRAYWRNFCSTADLVLFVIDASDKEKFSEAREYIFEIVAELEDSIDFHIVATKTDEKIVSLQQLEDILGVKRLNIPIHSVDYDNEDSAQELLNCCLAKLS